MILMNHVTYPLKAFKWCSMWQLSKVLSQGSLTQSQLGMGGEVPSEKWTIRYLGLSCDELSLDRGWVDKDNVWLGK